MAEGTRKKAPGSAMARVLRNKQGATGPADLEARLHALRPLEPSAEYVALVNQEMGRQTDPRGVVGQPLGGGYDPLPVRPGAERARLDAQAVEYSGTGAPGMVYANKGGAPVLMPLASARQQGLQIISADVAAELGEQAMGREAFSGAEVSGGPASGAHPAFAGAKVSGTPDPRMLAALLRAGR